MMSLQVRLVWHISHCISWRLCFFWFTDIFAAQEVQRGNATEVAAVDSSSPFSVSWSLNGSTPMGESKTFWKLTATQSVKFGRKRTASADHMCHTCVSVLQLCPTLSGLRGQPPQRLWQFLTAELGSQAAGWQTAQRPTCWSQSTVWRPPSRPKLPFNSERWRTFTSVWDFWKLMEEFDKEKTFPSKFLCIPEFSCFSSASCWTIPHPGFRPGRAWMERAAVKQGWQLLRMTSHFFILAHQYPPPQTFHPSMQAWLGGILPGSERNRGGLSNRTTQATGEENGADVWVYFSTLWKAEGSRWRFRMREFCVLYMEICGLAAEIKAASEEKDGIQRGPIRVHEHSECE